MTHSRLPIIFDLDETLLMALSLHGLESRVENCRQRRSLVEATDPRSGALASEERFLQHDLDLLREFSEFDRVYVGRSSDRGCNGARALVGGGWSS